MPSGIFMARPQSLTAISAWLPGEWHMMRSPTLKSRTCAPASTTSPANSLPIGRPVDAPWLVSPRAEPRSARLSAIALILTRMSVGLGLGGSMSLITTPSGDATPAFMEIPPAARATASTHLLLRLHLVPPRADARHAVVVAVEHLHRLALAVLGRLDAQQPRLLALFRRHPAPLMAPQTR